MSLTSTRFVLLAVLLRGSAYVDASHSTVAPDGCDVTTSDDLVQKCKKLKQATIGMSYMLGLLRGEWVLAGASSLVSESEKQAALDYIGNCTSPVVGPVPEHILLMKWNSDGNYIYPGTKWCGAGNISIEGDQYGSANVTDKCCEEHDRAKDYILESETHPNHTELVNPKSYTVTNCADDIKLFNCLLEDNSTDSYQFGQAFFDALGVPCFAYTLKVSCTSYSWWSSMQQCEVKANETEKKWQFLDPPNFYAAFTKKWYPDKEITTKDEEGKVTWRELCEKDPGMGCHNCDFLK
ncbi:group 3 secretory phospholipase A2-like [Ornithodoros turicata]|uniref:group 3 secretory phospholipase A2-like n=1 Tax=Ornithodoros turicata TaxID=34597 RepID=UPI0031397881